MKIRFALLGMLFALFAVSCEKEGANTEEVTAIENDDITMSAKVNGMSDDVSKIAVEQALTQVSGANARVDLSKTAVLPSGAQVTVTLNKEGWKRVVDFGNEGCKMANGNVLKGKIVISGNFEFLAPSYKVTCVFDGFVHNGFAVNGTEEITRTMKLPENNLVLEVKVDYNVTNANGFVRYFKGKRVHELVEGSGTTTETNDDVFKITGDEVVTSKKGTLISTTIKPLIYKTVCNYVVEGTILHTKNDHKATVDYGNGECDNSVVVTIGGFSSTVILNK